MENLSEGRKVLKSAFPDMTEEDLNKVIPGINRWAARYTDEKFQYKLVAECYYSQYCGAGIKVGDKLVMYGAVVDRAESTAPLCALAIAPLVTHYWSLTDKILLGVEDPNMETMHPVSVCLDKGIEDGGLGHVKFKVSFVKVSKQEFANARGRSLLIKEG
jgi:hypothetical protein